MKKLISYFMAIGLVFLMASGVAMAGKDDGCRFQGSWISFTDNMPGVPDGIPTWVAGIHGQSASSGTNELEFPAFDADMGVPPGAGTQMRGAWERTGGNNFAYTMMGYGYNPVSGAPVYAIKMSGTITLYDACDTGDVTASINIYDCDPACNPYTDEPDDSFDYPTTTAYRVMVE